LAAYIISDVAMHLVVIPVVGNRLAGQRIDRETADPAVFRHGRFDVSIAPRHFDSSSTFGLQFGAHLVLGHRLVACDEYPVFIVRDRDQDTDPATQKGPNES
jgi:hypothetical protein